MAAIERFLRRPNTHVCERVVSARVAHISQVGHVVPRSSNVGTRPSKRGIRGRFEGSGRFALRKILGTLLRVAVAPRVVSSWSRSGCRFRRSDVARRATRGVARRGARRTAARSSPRRRATAFCHGGTRRGGRTARFAHGRSIPISTHLGVRFVPGFVSDETRLGCVYIETLAWKARKQPPRDLTRIAHALSSDRYSEHGESVLRKVDLSSPEATACKRAAHGAGME